MKKILSVKKILLALLFLPTIVFAATVGVDSPQTANTVLAGPTSGGNANPTFRALVAADIGSGIITNSMIAAGTIDLSTKVTNVLPIANGGSNGATKQAGFDNLSPTIAKGDIIVFNGTNNVPLTAGTNNFVLTADSTTGTGLKWAAAGSGGSFSALTGGTNTSAAMLVGNGASLAATGTGTVTANQFVGTGSTTNAVDLATAEVSGILTLAKGGTGADLSATGAAHSVLLQTSVGGNITVALLAEGDLPATTVFTDVAATHTAADNFGSYVAFQQTSPAQITSDQTAFSPGAFSYVRINSNALWNIQGIVAGVNGQYLNFVNVGSSNIVLANQNAAATAVNRIISPSGADSILQPNYGAALIYDTTDSRWRILNIYQVPGGGTGFGTLSAGTNTTAAMLVGTGASLSPTGSGTVTANAYSGILPGANGGTNNGFMQFGGPAASLKTFTLPNSSANILTDAAAITVAQGGTGIATTTAYGLITGGTTTTGNFQNAGTGSSAQLLISQGAAALPTWNSLGGDATIGNTGTLTIANGAITNAKIAATTIDLTAKVTGILPVANGGTNNAFFGIAGPATTQKTYTVPNANCNILTDNAVVTVTQGGTGNASVTAYTVVCGGTSGTAPLQTVSGVGTAGNSLQSSGASSLPTWTALNLAGGVNYVTGLLPTANGGTNNAFFGISGPASTLKTYTFPNATCNILTDNAAITVAQGGTGVATTTAYGLITGGTTATGAWQNTGTGTTGNTLSANGASALPTWSALNLAGGANYVSGILPSANGGTANAFFTIAGPATTTKTYTVPNATCNILTDNATLTVAQGGTGLATLTAHGVLVGEGTSAVTPLSVMTDGQFLVGKTSNDPQVVTLSGDITTTTNAGVVTFTATNTHLTTLANLTTVGTIATGTWNGTTIAIANGGSGQTSAQNALNAFAAASGALSKGDFLVYNGSNLVRQPVGSNAQVLIADSAQTTGVRWGAASGMTASLPLVITGSDIEFGTAVAPTTIDANADVGIGASAVGKRPLTIQTKLNNTKSAIQVQNSAGTMQWDIDNSTTSNADVTETLQTSNTSNVKIQSISENITIAAAATSSSSTNLIPANSFIIGVAYNVTTVIPTATTFSIGDSVSSTRFGTGISTTGNTTNTSLLQTNPCSPFTNGTATTILITPNSTPGANTGRIRATVWYITLGAPGN